MSATPIMPAVLSLDFLEDEAELQLETIVNWGRYAEVVIYDDDNEMFYLEMDANPAIAG